MSKGGRLPPVPETQLGELIRSHAAVYKSKGRDEHAGGMMQAADIVDGALNQAGTGDPTVARVVMLEARVLKLEEGKPPLPPEMDRRSARGKKTPREVAADLVGAIDEGLRRQRGRRGTNGVAAAPASTSASETAAGEDVALAPGELRALQAAAQVKQAGRSNDELIAIIGYKATSLRTFLGNLRAAGYIVTVSGRHYATMAGETRVAGLGALPVGSDLLKAAIDQVAHTGVRGEKISAGESKILQCISHGVTEKHTPQVATSALAGDATGLQATSVRTYLTKLSARRFVVRGRGTIMLAPILCPGAK